MIMLLLGRRGLVSLRGLFDEQALGNTIEREAIAFPNRSHGSRETAIRPDAATPS
jgi:hypothetical protein